MTKITPEHLARTGIVYVRQSSPHQVANNLESQRRQYALVARGQQLGWSDVQVIDDDLGRSGNGISRPGFERLLACICEGRVGAVLSIEASRLARNGRDWHTLLEFCGLVGTLIIDEDGISVLPVTSLGLDHKISSERVSTGIAVQWLSPMGLFKFSYAYPLVYQNETRRQFGDLLEEFQFSVGQAF